jgi:predicted RNA-binding Zn ribbon-like protein
VSVLAGWALDGHLPVKRIALSALALLRDGEPHRLRRCAKRWSQ